MWEFFSKGNNSTYLIYIITILLIFIVWLIISIISWQRISRKFKELKNDMTFKKALLKCNLWLTVSMLWMISEYIFIIIPFEATAVVIYLDALEKDGDKNGILIHSILSLGLVVFSYAINPKQHMRCYRKSYTLLDAAINQILIHYKEGDPVTEDSKTKLINAIDKGEEIINSSYDINN